MYMGHLGIGLGARRFSPPAPLWLLFVASTAPDLADALSGFTPWGGSVARYSHTVYGILLLAIGLGLFGALLSRNAVTALFAAGLVVSHWIADIITSRMPAWPGGPVVGLGLYEHPLSDFFLELLVILGGLHLYRRSLHGFGREQAWSVAAMFACMVALQIVWDTMLLH